MILAIIVVWLLGSAAFFGSLAYIASRPIPSPDFEPAANGRCVEPAEPQWESEKEAVPVLAASTVSVS